MHGQQNIKLSHKSTVRSPFSNQLITSNFSSFLILFREFFTWTALGEADLRLSLVLVTNNNAVEAGTTSAA